MTALPPYAVVMKVHFWNAFTDRQLQRLRRRAGTDHLFVLADETKGPIKGISHDRVIRMTEQTSRDQGFLIHPEGRAFWYNTDYQLYHFIEAEPAYAYIVTVEYDCVVNVDIATIIAGMASRDAGFAGEPIRDPPGTWMWGKIAAPFYPADEIFGRLLCFAVFSRAFALALRAVRLEHTGRVLQSGLRSGKIYEFPWPNNEALVGAEIMRQGVRELPLAAFGDVSCYNWAPARPETMLPQLAGCGFIHPVLDLPGFLLALPRFKYQVDDVFDEDSFAGRILSHSEKEPLLHEVLQHYVRRRDLPGIERTRRYAVEHHLDLARIFNIARGKPATQSSTSDHSRGATPAADAAGALTGAASGGHGFHTDFDESPWWCLDLETACPVREIRIHNRLDLPERSRSLVVTASVNLAQWAVLYDHAGAEAFGGADGKPLTLTFPGPTAIRFLRLHLPDGGYLHLDQVEVFV